MSDDKIAEIRERHSREDRWRKTLPQIHDDRATLLAEVDRRGAENEKLRAANKQLVEGIDTITRRKQKEIERLRAQIALMVLEGKP